MTKEQWIKWEPIEGLDTVYTINEISNNLKDFTVLLIDLDNDKKKIRIFFKDSVDAYRYTEECYRLNIGSLFTQPTGENLYGRWGFF